MYIDKLADEVNEYNNIYHSKIKMKPIDGEASTYIDFDIKNNQKDSKFKVGDHVRLRKYFKKFKRLCSRCVWRSFCNKKFKNTVSRNHITIFCKDTEYLERFFQNNCKRQIKENLG